MLRTGARRRIGKGEGQIISVVDPSSSVSVLSTGRSTAHDNNIALHGRVGRGSLVHNRSLQAPAAGRRNITMSLYHQAWRSGVPGRLTERTRVANQDGVSLRCHAVRAMSYLNPCHSRPAACNARGFFARTPLVLATGRMRQSLISF